MIQLQNFPYQRPDIQALEQRFAQSLSDFEQAKTAAEAMQAFEAFTALRQEIDSLESICSIRFSQNTSDSFYEAENKFFDDYRPVLSDLQQNFQKALVGHRYRAELEAKYGSYLFALIDMQIQSFSPEIIEQLQQENSKSSDYRKIKSQAKIEFEGKTYTLPALGLLEQDQDRQRRKAAAQAKWGFYTQKAPETEGIYDNLVKNRHAMAQKLGFENFIGMGYMRMLRSDYNADMVAILRREVVQELVPVCQEIYARQAKRLGLEKLAYYDEGYKFPSGNPKPKGGVAWQTERAGQMYKELSPETAAFFEEMQARNLMDLENRANKEPGGYCTFVPSQQAPFIFANFNGTSHDVVVLTHEAGHAFQVYSTAKEELLYDYLWPSFESCEIHSMSMEFLTWPWMQLFFEEDADKFRFAHLESTLRFIPYGCAVDEFQHQVYAQPNISLQERNALWRELERKYLPQRDYEGNAFLEAGGFWQCQQHIFSSPFYYIDYVLAQLCALQFWQSSQAQEPDVWQRYLGLCKAGGSASFLELLKLGKLRSPFEPGLIKDLVSDVRSYLQNIDDSTF